MKSEQPNDKAESSVEEEDDESSDSDIDIV